MKTLKQILNEDSPTNNMGSGNIAGAKADGSDVPVTAKSKISYIKRKIPEENDGNKSDV